MEKINQNNQTGKVADHVSQLRETTMRQWTTWAGLAEGQTKTQSWLWATAFAMVGETPSVTLERNWKVH